MSQQEDRLRGRGLREPQKMIMRLYKVAVALVALALGLALLPFVILSFVAGVIQSTADAIIDAFTDKDEREA